MSQDSLAILRKNVGAELADLAEDHFQHDLQQSDRDTLRAAASSFSLHATVGSAVGLSIGLFLALRLARGRAMAFQSFKAAEQPVALKFANGHEQALPDMRPLLKPSVAGSVATSLLFGAGGLFIGGETGLLTGAASARRSINSDPESRKRIEAAFRNFRVDVLKKQINDLEKGSLSGSGRPEIW